MGMSLLDQLKTFSTVVCDTGDIDLIREFLPQDATTNPTLLFQAAQKPQYHHLIQKALRDAEGNTEQERRSLLMDLLFVNFGLEILKIIPGRVSTEVDASLSFDSKKTIDRALRLIALYEKAGIPRERILVKIASTWEGIRAAEMLEMDGVHCNMTLLFSLPQAVACGEAHVKLISPFVGRVLDWYKEHKKDEHFDPQHDPGVRLVHSIYDYYKKFGIKTEIMGASFRSKEQVLELAGCDLLTISPQYLNEMSELFYPIQRKLSPEESRKSSCLKMALHESEFRFMMNQDAMASDKLSEGIRRFVSDSERLYHYVTSHFS